MNRIKKTTAFVAGTLLSFILYSTTAFAADYTVVQNDSLYKIGVLFNTTSSTIKSNNSLSSDVIYPGQVLNVPAEVHTIKSGDTLFLISKQYGITLFNLRKANNKWDDLVIPGQKLIIPSGKSTSSTSSTVTTSKTVIPYTEAEVDLLARLITAEAEGETYEAKVAVGAVVVNRVKSTVWPNTITDVIYHVSGGYQQFTPVKNGYINKPATSDSIKAAWAALYGSDPSKGAMFYFDDSSTNQWLWSKPQTAYIDNMVFVK
jgi:LysM repeat protein